MSPRELTGAALAALLGRAADAAIADRVALNARRLAGEVAGAGRMPDGFLTTIRPAGSRAAVAFAGEGLFAREFGGRFLPADPLVAPALARLSRRRR